MRIKRHRGECGREMGVEVGFWLQATGYQNQLALAA